MRIIKSFIHPGYNGVFDLITTPDNHSFVCDNEAAVRKVIDNALASMARELAVLKAEIGEPVRG